jgi:Na+/H+ antiporter NhaD/arsenite permease-like protein
MVAPDAAAGFHLSLPLKLTALVLLSVYVVLSFEIVHRTAIALDAAGVLLVMTRAKPEKVFHDVDWTTLIFFAGLFVIISGAEHTGMIDILSKTALSITGSNPWATFFLIIWMAAIASAFVDNIPFAVTMIPLISVLNQNGEIAQPKAALQ